MCKPFHKNTKQNTTPTNVVSTVQLAQLSVNQHEILASSNTFQQSSTLQ